MRQTKLFGIFAGALLCISLIACGSHAADFEYEVLPDNTIKITYYLGNEVSVTIPSSIDGRTVTAIGAESFYSHKQMRALFLPSTITTIENSAFYRCYSLENVLIPSSVQHLDTSAFFRCISLASIEVDENNPFYTSLDGVVFSKDMKEILIYPEGKGDSAYLIPARTETAIEMIGYNCQTRIFIVPSYVKNFPDCEMYIYPEDKLWLVEAGSAAEEYAKKTNLAHIIMNTGSEQWQHYFKQEE